MKIDSIGKRAISSYVMQFDQDELSGDQLQDPFVKFSQISDLTSSLDIEMSAIYSPKHDVVLSVNGQFARGQVTANPMTNWYSIDTGIIYTSSSGVNEPDGIKTTIFSKSEHCYYLGTTEGLYRTYNDDFSGCKRILSAQITAKNSSDAAEKFAHIHNVAEIGTGLYLMSVTGKTDAGVAYVVYDSTTNSLMCPRQSAGNSGWRVSNRVVHVDDVNAVVVFTSTDEASIVDVVTVDKLNKTISVQNVRTDADGSGTSIPASRAATHFMEELGDKMFFSHHYSDNPSGKKYKGLDYTDLSNITEGVYPWSASQIHQVLDLSSSRIYQIRTIGNALYVCCGLSGSDSLGLSKVTLDANGTAQCQSLTSDQWLSSYTEAKDIFYSEKAGKWSFCLGNQIYIADGDEDQWSELSTTSYGVSAEVYPRFNEFGTLATIFARDFPYADPEDPSKEIRPPETMLESLIKGGGLIATLDDIATRNIRVDGVAVDPDEHGFIDLNIKKTVEQSFQVVDQIPETMEEGKIYFVRKSLA